jgi:hypothetical protein
MIFSLQARRISVRTQGYRLDAGGALYDMAADPGQSRDIANEKPDIAAKLRHAVAQWRGEVLPLVGPDDRPFPVGYAPLTLLPARDGIASGDIRRSTAAPNCSWFTNWSSTEDRITWDVEVASTGVYQASLYYTCAKADAGSAIELGFGDSKVRARVQPVWDPPEIGREHDRVDRGQESYWKDFRALKLGSIRLTRGRGKLVLRALTVAGKQVADVRRIALSRIA